MILSGASRRGSKRAVLGSGNLHGRRHFIFLPYFHRHSLEQLIKRRRKGFPEDPFQLLFSTSRKNEKDPWKRSGSGSGSEKQVWGRKWEYEEKNGVSSEKTSEYISGKGWVDIRPEAENEKIADSSKKLDEEFEIDLITLRRVQKSTGQTPRAPDTSRENPESASGKSREPDHLGGSGGLTADQRLPPKSASANEKYPKTTLPGTHGKPRGGVEKAPQTNQNTVSGSNRAPPSEPPPSIMKVNEETRTTNPQKIKQKNEAGTVPAKGPQNPKPTPETITPPPKPVKSSESVVINPPKKYHTDIDVLQATPSKPNPPPTPTKPREVNPNPTVSSEIPLKPVADKTRQEFPIKPAEPLNKSMKDPPKHQAVNIEKSLGSAPGPLPASAGTSGTSMGPIPPNSLAGTASTAENIEIIPQPIQPKIATASDTVTGGTAGIWPADAVAALEQGAKMSSPIEAISDTSVDSATAIPEPTSPKPAKPATDSGTRVDIEARAADLPTELNETLPPPPSKPIVPLNTTLNATPTVLPKPADSVSSSATITAKDLPKELGHVTPPSLTVEEPLKHHRLNVSNRAGAALDAPDADLDLLLPSDIRAAAGAPGKIILKVEGGAEKAQRRAKMLADFEAAEEKRKLSEGAEIESLEAIKERIQNLSAVVQASVEKLAGELRANNIECDADNARRLLALSGSENTRTVVVEHPSGEKISNKGVLGTVNPAQSSPPQFAYEQATPQTNTNSTHATPASPPHKFFVLVRNPESDHMQFSTLPSGVVRDTMIRGNTAFDSLQSLDFPEKFLPLWRVLQKGGFTVVGGEKDCLVVKVEAGVAMEKQELVMKEIKLKLSPAEAVAREGWEKRRGTNQPEAEKPDLVEDASGKSLGDTERLVKVIVPTPHPTVIPEATIPSHDPQSKPEPVLEIAEETPHPKEEKQKESIPEAQATKPKKRRPFRRVFWAAVWVAACSGAVSVGLEEYI